MTHKQWPHHTSRYFNAYGDKPGHNIMGTAMPPARYFNANEDKPYAYEGRTPG